jgi:hypothetical protein
MAELKSTISIEIDGIKEFLNTTVQVERELLQIEKTLKKQGFKGSEKELRSSAKAYRDAMIKASKDIQAKEKERVSKLKGSLKEVGKVAAGVTVGGAATEIIGTLVRGLGNVIEKNKDANKSIGNLGKAFGKLQSTGASLAIGFLELVSGPIVYLVEGFESLTTAITGYNFEQARSLQLLNEQNAAFNEEVDALLAVTEAIDARTTSIQKLNETSNIASRLSIDASNEEIKLYRELVNLQNKFNIATGNKSVLVNQINRKSAEFEALVVRKAAELLTITKEQLLVKKELNTLSGGEQRKLDEILKSERLRTEELRKQEEFRQRRIESIRRDAANITGASEDVQTELNKAIDEGRFADAERLSKELETISKAFEDSTSVLNQAEETVSQLTRQLISTNVAIGETGDLLRNTAFSMDSLFDKFKEQGVLHEIVNFDALTDEFTDEEITKFKNKFSDLLRKNGTQIELFQTPDLSNKQADEIFLDVISNFSGEKVIAELAKRGITSKVLDTLLIEIDSSEKVKKQLTEQIADTNKIIAEQGIDVAKKQEKLDNAIIDSQNAVASKRIEIQKRVTKEALQSSQQIFDILVESGQADQTDLLLVKAKEFSVINDELINSIKVSNEELKGLTGVDVLRITYENGSESIQVLNKDLADSNSELVDKINNDVIRLKSIRSEQLIELEDLGAEFTKRALDSFSKQFAKESQLLEVALANKKLDIVDAENDRLEDQIRFEHRRLAQERDLNNEEISILEAHTRNIIKLEDERFKQEQYLRVGAFLVELDDISKRGGDVEVETKKFQLKERELLLNHYRAMKDIAERGAVDVGESLKKAFFSPEEAKNLALLIEQTFSDVFSAYASYQDSVAQKAIDSIQSQLDVLNESISDTTNNINSLESDLEGKRSGRREAILRGLAIEADRQEMLTDKKISLEKKLRIAEKKASDDRKAAAIGQALINGAIAITNVWANSTIPYPAQAVFGAIQTGALAAITGLQIATIENQTFSEGGMLEGPSHSKGGIPFTISGQSGFEAEGGEAIMSQKTVNMFKPQLHAMQVASGSKGLYADGGMLGASANFSAMNEALNGSTFRQLQMISERPTYVSVTDINNLQSRQVRVTDVTTL